MKDETEIPWSMALWHKCYCRWYDNDKAGNKIRTAFWGVLTDQIARWSR